MDRKSVNFNIWYANFKRVRVRVSPWQTVIIVKKVTSVNTGNIAVIEHVVEVNILSKGKRRGRLILYSGRFIEFLKFQIQSAIDRSADLV